MPGVDEKDVGVIEAWVTDDDLLAAHRRFSTTIPGWRLPAAYAVARADPSGLRFGHVNRPGAVRPLPAVILASVCGYAATTGVHRLDHARFGQVIDLLNPAEAATHMPHPNLWSWRTLLADARPDSVFLAFFLADLGDPALGPEDERFRDLLDVAATHR
jgi:hypothetical protein